MTNADDKMKEITYFLSIWEFHGVFCFPYYFEHVFIIIYESKIHVCERLISQKNLRLCDWLTVSRKYFAMEKILKRHVRPLGLAIKA